MNPAVADAVCMTHACTDERLLMQQQSGGNIQELTDSLTVLSSQLAKLYDKKVSHWDAKAAQ